MAAADTIYVALERDLARALRDSVDAGDYRSVNDAMRDAVRLWHERRSDEALSSIKARIERSQRDTRPSLSSEDVDRRLEALFARTASDDGA